MTSGVVDLLGHASNSTEFVRVRSCARSRGAPQAYMVQRPGRSADRSDRRRSRMRTRTPNQQVMATVKHYEGSKCWGQGEYAVWTSLWGHRSRASGTRAADAARVTGPLAAAAAAAAARAAVPAPPPRGGCRRGCPAGRRASARGGCPPAASRAAGCSPRAQGCRAQPHAGCRRRCSPPSSCQASSGGRQLPRSRCRSRRLARGASIR